MVCVCYLPHKDEELSLYLRGMGVDSSTVAPPPKLHASIQEPTIPIPHS